LAFLHTSVLDLAFLLGSDTSLCQAWPWSSRELVLKPAKERRNTKKKADISPVCDPKMRKSAHGRTRRETAVEPEEWVEDEIEEVEEE